MADTSLPSPHRAPRIVVLRLSSMGDVIHAMPAIAALRAAHPEAHIGWAIEPAWAPLLQSVNGVHNRPLVNAVHRVPFKKWSRNLLSFSTLREVRATQRELQDAHYDVAIDLQGSLRSALALRWTHAPRRLGEDDPRERVARLFYRERIRHAGRHVIEQDLEIAGAIFNETLEYRTPPFPADAEAQAWVEATLRQHPAARYALLLPGAGWGAKRWPAERYARVAIALRASGIHAFVNAGPGEESLAEQVRAGSEGFVTVVNPTLPQLIALLRRTALCIGGDTGPLHLACALQVPTVGIYGPTDPARNGPFYNPTKPVPHHVLRSSGSRRDHARRSEPEPGLLTITAQDVVAAAESVLAQISSEVRP